jgi:hypothetical protein
MGHDINYRQGIGRVAAFTVKYLPFLPIHLSAYEFFEQKRFKSFFQSSQHFLSAPRLAQEPRLEPETRHLLQKD